MIKDFTWLKNLNYVLVSLGIYVLVFVIFIFNLNWFYQYNVKAQIIGIREGLLLPQVEGVETLFNVDPLVSTSKDSTVINIRKKVSNLLFSSLFKENTSGTLDNDLVKSYTFTDAKDLILEIRDDVIWSDGQKLTAEDVEFTINTIRSLGSETIYSGAANAGDIDIAVISPTQLKITLEKQDVARPNASYIYELTFPILPKHILVNYAKPDFNVLPITDFGKRPVTSGLFLYEQNTIDGLNLSVNENYYGEKLQINNYYLKFYRNYDDLLNAFKLRNIDFFIRDENLRDSIHNNFLAENLEFTQTILRNRKIVLYFNTAAKSETASVFNNFVSPRRALLQAVSRQKIIDELGISLREIYGPIDQKSWAFSDDVTARNAFNPAELEKTLKILDYEKVNGIYQKEGKNLNIKITYLDNSFNKALLDSIKNQLQDLGIEVKLENLFSTSETASNATQDSYNSVVSNRDFDILLTYVDKNLDPDEYSEWHSSSIAAPGLNFSSFGSRVADRALSDGRILSKQEERRTQYLRFQKAFYDESTPAFFLFNPSTIIYYRKDLNLSIPQEINTVSSIYNNLNTWSLVAK